jgi:hypothetical protein
MQNKTILAGVRARFGSRAALWSITDGEPIKEEPSFDISGNTSIDDILKDTFRSAQKLSRRSSDGSLKIRGPSGGISVTLKSPPPDELFFYDEDGLSVVGLEIAGIEPSSAQDAMKLLFDISHAIFFDLDANYSITLQLVRRRENTSVRVGDQRQPTSLPPDLPTLRFPRDAIALYMHACTVHATPLTAYLTYYQVIEHCMAALSKPNAIRRLRERLTDPAFDLDDDVALAELLPQTGRRSQANTSERDQIRLAIRACIKREDIEAQLRADESLANFVSDPSSVLANHLIDVNGDPANLLGQLADRIYDLRCRIVHAKGNVFDEAGGPLLPFNADAELLQYDLVLIRFVAQHVLLTAGIPADW